MNYIFTSKNCSKCKLIAPVIDKLEREGHKFIHVSIDTTDGLQTAEGYDVLSVPTLIIDGQSLIGVASESVIRELLNK